MADFMWKDVLGNIRAEVFELPDALPSIADPIHPHPVHNLNGARPVDPAPGGGIREPDSANCPGCRKLYDRFLPFEVLAVANTIALSDRHQSHSRNSVNVFR